MRPINTNTIFYAPSQVPSESENLHVYVGRELDKIKNAVEQLARGHLEPTYVAPVKPRDGDIRLADGTRWNPGSGKGIYGFYNNVWNFLTVGENVTPSTIGFNIKDYGAKGDGVTNDQPAIQAAVEAANAAGGGIVYFPPGTYGISGASIELKSNVVLSMYGAKLKLLNSANVPVIRISASATNVSVLGGEIDGNKANNPTGGGGIVTTTAAKADFITIRDVYAHDCKTNGITILGIDAANPTKYMTLQGCTLRSNGSSGISANFIEEFTWINNSAINNGTYGIAVTGVCKHGTISGNMASGSVVGANFGFTNAGNSHLTLTGNVSRDGGSHGIHVGGRNLTITGNDVYHPAQAGICINNSDSSEVFNVTVSGNTIENALVGGGIFLNRVKGFSVTGNTVTASQHGIFVNGVSLNGNISGNTCHANNSNGISLDGITLTTLSGNVCYSNTGNGIEIYNSSMIAVKSNTCRNNAIGIVESGTTDAVHYAANAFGGNTSDTPVLIGAGSVYEATNRSGAAVATAASAATVTLPKYGTVISITGTTGITSITASWSPRQVTLKFDGALTVTDGSNLKLAGNFTSAVDRTLTLICDGTNWYEIARSVN